MVEEEEEECSDTRSEYSDDMRIQDLAAPDEHASSSQPAGLAEETGGAPSPEEIDDDQQQPPVLAAEATRAPSTAASAPRTSTSSSSSSSAWKPTLLPPFLWRVARHRRSSGAPSLRGQRASSSWVGATPFSSARSVFNAPAATAKSMPAMMPTSSLGSSSSANVNRSASSSGVRLTVR